MVLDHVMVALRVCWLCLVPRRWSVRVEGLVVVVGVLVVLVVVWCGVVRRYREVGLWGLAALGRGGDAAGGGRCSIGALGGNGLGGGGGVVVVLVVPCPLALRE